MVVRPGSHCHAPAEKQENQSGAERDTSVPGEMAKEFRARFDLVELPDSVKDESANCGVDPARNAGESNDATARD